LFELIRESWWDCLSKIKLSKARSHLTLLASIHLLRIFICSHYLQVSLLKDLRILSQHLRFGFSSSRLFFKQTVYFKLAVDEDSLDWRFFPQFFDFYVFYHVWANRFFVNICFKSTKISHYSKLRSSQLKSLSNLDY